MTISSRTRRKIGLHKGDVPEVDDQVASALGVVSTVDSRVQISKAEKELLQSRALTVEDDPWNMLPNERRTNLLRPTYDPVVLIGLCIQNNTLGQCVDALEVNIDGTGYDIERKDEKTPAEGEKDDSIEAIKGFFNEAYIGESFTAIRRKVRRDRTQTGNAYLEVIRNQAGEITLVNHVDAKLVRMVKLDEAVEVEQTITRNGKEMTVKMLVRERRFAQLIGNKVRYFREFGSSREVDQDTGAWMGPAKKPPPSKLSAPVIKDPPKPGEVVAGAKPNGAQPPGVSPPVQPTAPGTTPSDGKAKTSPGAKKPNPFAKATGDKPSTVPDAQYNTGPKPEDDPTKKPKEEAGTGVPGNELIHFMDVPDVTTPYGVPRWINQIPSVLGSRKAEELNLEYFNHGGLPPVMIFLQGGQLASASKTLLNQYLSGEAKTKLRGVVAEVYATGGDLTANSSVKTTVERFGGDNLQDSMFEGYDERCANRVRSAFRLPPLFTGDTQDYNFATAYASYVVAEAQVFKPERELFDEKINNTIMQELAPDYVYRSLPMTVHDVAVQIQALTLAKDVTDRKTFVDEVNEIAGLSLTFQDPMTDPMSPANPASPLHPANDPKLALLAAKQDPFAKPGDKPAEPNPFAPKGPFGGIQQPVKGGPPKKPMPAGFAKADSEAVGHMSDETFLRLAEDWSAHLSGDRQFEAPTVNFMKSVIDAFHPQVRKLFNAYVGMKMAPGAKYDPDGISDLIACAGDCLTH